MTTMLKDKKIIWAIAAIVVLTLVAIAADSEDRETAKETEQGVETEKITPPSKTTSGAVSKKSVQPQESILLPELEIIDKRLAIGLKNYSNVDMTIDRVAIGRGEASVSTGCQGIPNTNFSTYLYPGSGVCIGAEEVDGVPRAILAVHALIENNGNYGFGGNGGAIVLHYLRASTLGKPVHRFAHPIWDLANYYIGPYSSKEVLLSYLIPEDQTAFDLLVDYGGLLEPNVGVDVYQSSAQGFFVDFKTKNLTLIKK